MDMSTAPSVVIPADDRAGRAGIVTGLVFVGALVLALLVRGTAPLGIAFLFVLFVPLEKLFALRRDQKVFRRGLVTDLTHILVNNLLITVGVIVLVAASALPFIWIRRVGIADLLPAVVSIPLAVALVFVGSYWGHRLTHTVPMLWRFHAVHHSIE